MTRERAVSILIRERDEDPFMRTEYREQIHEALNMAIEALEQGSKTGRCKDCKWWKDSDGAYRRGIRAESRCPINTVSVANGVGYCYMFKPQESEGKK